MSFRYSVGLQNVGSYQVSARPWLKSTSFTGVQSAFYEFPNVTDHIKITNDIGGVGNDLDIVFCEPKRAISLNATNEYYDTTFSALTEFTISIWVKTGATTAGQRVVDFNPVVGSGTGLRTSSGGTPKTRLLVDGTNVGTGTTTITADTWFNFTITIKDGEQKVFVNGNLEITGAATFGSATGLELGDASSALNLDGTYDEVALFSSVLTDVEISNLWNNGAMIKPAHTSLISHWAFEDNNYKTIYSSPDTLGVVLDRVSGNDLTLNGSSANVAFVDGRLLENALERHKITLEGQQEIRLNCKSKQVFLRSTGTTDVNVSAGLTGIPANRMFELTGTGIDE